MNNFKKDIENEIIVLSHLENINSKYFGYPINEFYGSPIKLKEESIVKYVKIDSKKVEELKNKFLNYKLKTNFSSTITIDNTRIYEFIDKEKVAIYSNDKTFINKLLDIEIYSNDIEFTHYYNKDEKNNKKLNKNLSQEKRGMDSQKVEIEKKTNLKKINYPLNKYKLKINSKTNLNKDNITTKKKSKSCHKRGYKKGDAIVHPETRGILLLKELDNHDLILFCYKERIIELVTNIYYPPCISREYKLCIYRFGKKKYSLFQQEKYDNEIKSIDKLSGNRFLSITKYKVEVYSLNQDNKYSILKSFEIPYVFAFNEIKENQFIFCTREEEYDNKNNKNIFPIYNNPFRIFIGETIQEKSFKIFFCDKILLDYVFHKVTNMNNVNLNNFNMNNYNMNKLNMNNFNMNNSGNNNMTNMINMTNMTNMTNNNMINITNNNMSNNFRNNMTNNNMSINNLNNNMMNMSNNCNNIDDNIAKVGTGDKINEEKNRKPKGTNFSDFIVLKNKYGIIMIDQNLLIIDILNEKIIKKYKILYYNNTDNNEKLMSCYHYKIKKWNNITDNEFILIIKGNITIFELNDESGINLKIVAHYYFKNFYDNDDFLKVDENNTFCLTKYENNNKNYIFY